MRKRVLGEFGGASKTWQETLKTKGWTDTYLAGDAFDKQLAADIGTTGQILKDIGLAE